MKTIIKKILPNILSEFIRIKRRTKYIKSQSSKDIFTLYKNQNFWNSSESISGEGSELWVTKNLRSGIEELFSMLNIRKILDIPCGDFNWMKAVDLRTVYYQGADIVASIVHENNELYSKEHISFKELDLTKDPLPKVDLILCRDCLVHLSYKDIYMALMNIKSSQSKYLLTTSFVNSNKNKDIITGEWRKINLEIEPFNLGKPIRVIDEKYLAKGERYEDKSMCLWHIDQIQLSWQLKLYSKFI